MENARTDRGRISITESESSIKIVIPSLRRPLRSLVILLLVALVLYLIIQYIEPFSESTWEDDPVNIVFLCILLIIITIGWIIVALWALIGKEIIFADKNVFIISRQIGILTFRNKYLSETCHSFEINSGERESSFIAELIGFINMGLGRLTFETGSGTVKFADGINESEAGFIMERLENKGYIQI